MKFKRLVPLALALAIASTTAAEAARLPQNRFSFAVRPSYTQTVSHPSASKPLQSTAANSSYAAQVVSLVNAERAKQGLPALIVSTTVQQAAQTRAGELKSSFSHTRPNGASCFTALTEAGVSYTRAGENIAYGQSSPHTGRSFSPHKRKNRPHLRSVEAVAKLQFRRQAGTDRKPFQSRPKVPIRKLFPS